MLGADDFCLRQFVHIDNGFKDREMSQNRPSDGISRQSTVPVQEVQEGISRKNYSSGSYRRSTSSHSYSGYTSRSASSRSYSGTSSRSSSRRSYADASSGKTSSARSGYGKGYGSTAAASSRSASGRNSSKGHSAASRESYRSTTARPSAVSSAKRSRTAPNHYDKRRQRKRRMSWQRFVPVAICVAVMLYGGINLINYGLESLETRRTNKRLQEMYEAMEAAATPVPTPSPTPAITPEPTATPEPIIMDAKDLPSVAPVATLLPVYQMVSGEMQSGAMEFYNENNDFVAWIRIPGVVSLPVVYRDNTYYLNHDFNGRESKSGTLFLDEAHPMNPETQHLVVHGHNMHDGTMFGLLPHYRNKDYIDKHPTITWNTLYRKETYEVFAVLIVPENTADPQFLAYTGRPVFKTVSQFESYIATLKSRALRWKDIDINPTDALITLSTCLDDNRLLVVGRRTT